jgi:hypothetical protein
VVSVLFPLFSWHSAVAFSAFFFFLVGQADLSQHHYYFKALGVLLMKSLVD